MTLVKETRINMLIEGRSVQPRETQFVPIMHSDLYFRDLERAGQDTALTRHLHSKFPILECIPLAPKIKLPIPDFADYIPVELKVVNGRVRCILHTGMLNLYEKMQKTHKKPSIEERLMAAKDFGYPMEVLKRMLLKHEQAEASKEALNDFVISVFGEMSDKKTTAPKKRNLYQVLKIKKQVYAVPDADDVVIQDENENEDAVVPEED